MENYSLIYKEFGLPIDKQMELDTLTFNSMLADALRLRLKGTQEGQDYLMDCWRMAQEGPDLSAIAKLNNSKIKEVTNC